MSEPYRSPAEHFDDHGVRLLLFLKAYVLRFWRRLTDPAGNLNDLYVSLHEALAALGVDPGELGVDVPGAPRGNDVRADLETLEAEIRGMNDHIERRLEAATGDAFLPIEDLRALFRLTDAELDVVLLLARLQTDLDFCRLCTFAWADFTHRQPDVAFLAEVLAVPTGRRAELARALAVGGRLVRHGIVAMQGAGDTATETPHFFMRVALSNRIVRFLLPDDEARQELPEGCSIVDQVPPRLFMDPGALRATDAAMAWARGEPRALVALYGPQGVGKTALAATLARRLGKRLLAISLDGAAADDPAALEDRVAQGLREAILIDAVPLVDLGRMPVESDTPEGRSRTRALARGLEARIGVVFLSAVEPQPGVADLGPVEEVPIAFTPSDEQRRAWDDLLSGDVAVSRTVDPGALANRFNLTAGQIHRVVRSAGARRGRRVGGVEIGEEHLVAAAQREVRHRLGVLATPLYTGLGWDDLILPSNVMEELRDIERMMQHQLQVYNQWEFRRIAAGRRGVAALFSGPPGTGKTLTATVLGRSLSRQVFRIDLSRIVDKYIGETEKNLARLFDESEHSPVILLFDEADSLFTTRTEVQSSHDRNANLQVNFLLQRIESFEGLCILTTNNEPNIDEAFRRRLRFIVHFPEPDLQTRVRLWRSMIPPEAGVEGEIDWQRLATTFAFSGGHIRNAVLRAAFLAATEHGPIRLGHLRTAATLEARHLGQLVRDVNREEPPAGASVLPRAGR